MKKNNRGFTLVELLAVIVILGLLMAIAIPSVTKYITQSRIKTLVTTMDSYITAVITQVNDGEYKFSDSTKVFAIPIECISLEKGGQNPFGNWYQANSSYWAYVLVHYDSNNYNYEYGFTFKDDAGYGLYPTINDSIVPSMVRTGYDDLHMPVSGPAVEFVTIDKWEGFSNITSSTKLVVLESESEGVTGNGSTTCTLCQKGDNYDAVEEEKINTLSRLIKKHNTLITVNPTLNKSSEKSGDVSGLYSSNNTNSGKPTYYFRGNVTNNYVSFAGFMWRVLRINEEGTVRLILNQTISNVTYKFNRTSNSYNNMYYSNGCNVKTQVDSWYQTNIVDKGYDSYIATEVFCEQAKVKKETYATSGNALMDVYTSYLPNFKCVNDLNGKGMMNGKVGLISYDEAIHAGVYHHGNNKSYYLYNGGYGMWTLSPAGFDSAAEVWGVTDTGYFMNYGVYSNAYSIRPVINLNANVLATGKGTSSDPYIVSLD